MSDNMTEEQRRSADAALGDIAKMIDKSIEKKAYRKGVEDCLEMIPPEEMPIYGLDNIKSHIRKTLLGEE